MIEASAEQALYTSIASEEGVTVDEVAEALTHRTFPDDYFWSAWDHNVGAGRDLFRSVTGRPPRHDDAA